MSATDSGNETRPAAENVPAVVKIDWPLWLVRILRRIPHTAKFDRHLTDCAALAVIYHPFGRALPLKVAHVLRREPLSPFVPEGDDGDNVIDLRCFGRMQ